MYVCAEIAQRCPKIFKVFRIWQMEDLSSAFTSAPSHGLGGRSVVLNMRRHETPQQTRTLQYVYYNYSIYCSLYYIILSYTILYYILIYIYIYIYRNSELWWILHCRCVRDIRCIATKHCKAHMSSELTDAHSDQGIQPPAKRFKVWDKEKTGPFFSTFWPFSTTFGSYLQLLGTQKLRGDFDEVYNLLPFFSRVLDAMRACREV